MFEFKFGLGLDLGIQVWVVRTFEPFRVWTIGQPDLDIGQLYLCVILVEIL